ncbi:phage integrase family protein [Rheinheimera nanhaiensis E407-8]|uniref:Phage integrase family protein n=1 Tax=Rheinheimera nanhaiensis E407-8 TaxID=562729 RepID=I1DYQ0_9GAMM|nr:phage integrase family protein [Rheinheimera nanhaiensis E407-8]
MRNSLATLYSTPYKKQSNINVGAVNTLDQYLQAATRDNTRRSYQAAVEHFETQFGGVLPTTSTEICRYLAKYAVTLSFNTLKQRLSGLSAWHRQQGFADPTKSPMVRKVLKGIRELHPAREKQAKPLQLDTLAQISHSLDASEALAIRVNDQPLLLRTCRDRALVLVGFWRGFRGDELCRMEVEHISLATNEGMQIYLRRSKADRSNRGEIYRLPALARLCPVRALERYLEISGLSQGPVFRGISRWGHVSQTALAAKSIIPLLRQIFSQAGLIDADHYSAHSLRRGFATWAGQSGWSLKALMEYVGWKDLNSAMRYIDSPDPFLQSVEVVELQSISALMATHELELHYSLQRYHKNSRDPVKVRQKIDRFCLKPLQAECIDETNHRYRLTLATQDEAQLDERIDDLLATLYHMAQDHQCMIEITLTEPATGRYWD